MKLPTLILFLFFSDTLKKCCHKFIDLLQLSQSGEQEDFNSTNKFSI